MAHRPTKTEITPQEKAQKFRTALDARFPNQLVKDEYMEPGKPIEESTYRWWWEFMRASADMEGNTAIREVGEGAGETLDAFGDLGESFIQWWNNGGRANFQEANVPKIHLHMPESTTYDYIKRTGLLVLLPLTIKRDLIHEQIDVLLDNFHANKKFKRHEASTARLRIHPKMRHRKIDYGLVLRIWKIKQEEIATGGRKPNWEIYCLASNRIDEIEKLQVPGPGTMSKRDEYGKRCSELLQIGEDLMRNALLGSFPNDTAARTKKSRKSTKKTASHS